MTLEKEACEHCLFIKTSSEKHSSKKIIRPCLSFWLPTTPIHLRKDCGTFFRKASVSRKNNRAVSAFPFGFVQCLICLVKGF
jgi:hypothetical protein